jgi:hypothetical protein
MSLGRVVEGCGRNQHSETPWHRNGPLATGDGPFNVRRPQFYPTTSPSTAA